MNDTPEDALAWANGVRERGCPVYRGHEIVPVWHGRVGFRVHAGAHVFRGWTFAHAPGAVWFHTVDEAMNAVDVYEQTKDVPWTWGFFVTSPFWKAYYERYPVKDGERRFLAALRAEIAGMTFETSAQEREAKGMLDVIARCEASLACVCDGAPYPAHHEATCPVERLRSAAPASALGAR
jgi:hypothetical protein